MILAFLTLLPCLLWDEAPSTAPTLEKAGIHQIATTRDAAAWAGTRVRATQVDAGTLVKLDPPGVDYQLSRGGATAAPWINSNLWRELREPGKAYVYEVGGAAVALAAAEAYASGASTYFRLKQDDLAAFGAALRFLREIDGPPLPPRANFGLVDDRSAEMEEIMNLLVRRNLLFQPVTSAGDWKGTVVRLGTSEYPQDLAPEPYKFAAVVRGRIGDDRRLVRIYGSDTTIVRMYGADQRARIHLIQYGRRTVGGMRVRVLGRYPRVLVAVPGQRVTMPEDIAMDDAATEFTIPEFRTYAVVDLDQHEPGTLASAHSDRNFALTADPNAEPWRSAPSVKVDRLASGDPVPTGATEIRSRWTSDSLYLLYICPFRQLYLKPDPFTDRDTPQLWNWDVAEAFIGADGQNIGQYREYQMSPQGEWVDLDIDVVHPKPDGGIAWNSGYEVKARIDNEHKIWYGEMRIPLASIAARQFKAGDRLRLGLFRIAGPPDERFLVAWQPSFRRNFHVPEAFGALVLR
jgi:hypothetical protein